MDNFNNAQAPRAWQKVKSEEEFYEHLSEEMKATYHEYLNRMKEKNKSMNEKVDENKDNIFVSLLGFLVGGLLILGIFEIFGTATGVLDKNEEERRK